MTEQQIMEKGAAAESALPYIAELFKTAQDAILDRIIELSADQTFKFSVLKSELLCMEELTSMVHGDINAGKRVIEQLQGTTPQTGGIL